MPRKKINKEEPKSQETDVDKTAEFKDEPPKPNSNLKSLLSSLEKKYGEGIIANANVILDAEKVSTKVLLLDFLLK